MNETEIIAKIRRGEDLPSLEDVDLLKVVSCELEKMPMFMVDTTVLQELVNHNYLEELGHIVENSAPEKVKELFNTPLNGRVPLMSIVIDIIASAEGEWDYINPWPYKDLICLLVHNANMDTIVALLDDFKNGDNGISLYKNVVSDIEEIVNECLVGHRRTQECVSTAPSDADGINAQGKFIPDRGIDDLHSDLIGALEIHPSQVMFGY